VGDSGCGYATAQTTSIPFICTATPSKSRISPERPPPDCTKTLPSSGAIKLIDIDFTANQPGLSLFHCHQQLHMDFGFMALLKTT
jgi:FtsP/CotA-like multicopper oxidase with cupredoxin domain